MISPALLIDGNFSSSESHRHDPSELLSCFLVALPKRLNRHSLVVLPLPISLFLAGRPLHSSHTPLHVIQDNGSIRGLCPFYPGQSSFEHSCIRIYDLVSPIRVYPDPRARIMIEASYGYQRGCIS